MNTQSQFKEITRKIFIAIHYLCVYNIYKIKLIYYGKISEEISYVIKCGCL